MRSGGGGDEAADELRQLGMPEDEIDAALHSQDDDETFPIWPDNEWPLECFLHVRRIWRIGPTGGVLGLDRPGVEAELRMRNIEVDAALLDNLGVIEGGVIEVWNAKQ